MKRSKQILENRKQFIADYCKKNSGLQQKVVVMNLSERLFLSERTINQILSEIKKE